MAPAPGMSGMHPQSFDFGVMSDSGYGRWADHPAERSLAWSADTSVVCAVTSEMRVPAQTCHSPSVAGNSVLTWPLVLSLLAIAGLVYERWTRRGGGGRGASCGTQTLERGLNGGGGTGVPVEESAFPAVAAGAPNSPPRHGAEQETGKDVEVLQLEEALSKERMRVGRLETRLAEMEDKERRWAAREEEERTRRREERRVASNASSADSSPLKQRGLVELQKKLELQQEQQKEEAELRERAHEEAIKQLRGQLEEVNVQLRFAREDTVALCSQERELRLAVEGECALLKAEIATWGQGQDKKKGVLDQLEHLEQQHQAKVEQREAELRQEAEQMQIAHAQELGEQREQHRKETEERDRERDTSIRQLEGQHRAAREEMEGKLLLARAGADSAAGSSEQRVRDLGEALQSARADAEESAAQRSRERELRMAAEQECAMARAEIRSLLDGTSKGTPSPPSPARASPSPRPPSASASTILRSSSSPMDRGAWSNEIFAAQGAEGARMMPVMHGGGEALSDRSSLVSEARTTLHRPSTTLELEARLKELKMRLEAAEGEREALRGVLGASEARAEETEKLVKYQRSRLRVLEQRLSLSPASAKGGGVSSRAEGTPDGSTPDTVDGTGEGGEGGGGSRFVPLSSPFATGSINSLQSWAKSQIKSPPKVPHV